LKSHDARLRNGKRSQAVRFLSPAEAFAPCPAVIRPATAAVRAAMSGA